MPPLPLWRLSWREWTHHPWRHGIALLAVALGVALAWSVHLINASALSEFSAAVRSVNGQADLSLRAARGLLDETLYPQVAQRPEVAIANPVIELQTQARRVTAPRRDGPAGVRAGGASAVNAASRRVFCRSVRCSCPARRMLRIR